MIGNEKLDWARDAEMKRLLRERIAYHEQKIVERGEQLPSHDPGDTLALLVERIAYHDRRRAAGA